MECNKGEALRAMELAEEKLRAGDFIGAQKLVMKAEQLFPNIENLPQLVAICDVHCSAQNKICGLDNWYGILQVKHFANEAAIKKQYRKLALLLHPDKNKFTGAEAAFKLVGEANRLLTDQTKRSQYDVKYSILSRVSASKPGNKQSNTNSVRQYEAQNNVANSTGNQKPMNFAFWTCCEHCGFRDKYLREYVNTVMNCSRCQRSYVAVDTGPNGVSPRSTPGQFSSKKEVPSQWQCNVPLKNNSIEPTGVRLGGATAEMDTNMTREEKLGEKYKGDQKNDTEVRKLGKDKGGMKNDAEISKYEETKGGPMNDAEVPKGEVVKPQSVVTESKRGAAKPTPDDTDPKEDETATMEKEKKKRRKVVEESSESFKIGSCDNVGSEKAANENEKRRSSRKKQKVSYAEDGSDDDFVSPPSKTSKSPRESKSDDVTDEVALGVGLSGGANSDGLPAVSETHKEKAEKKTDSVSEDILSSKDKQSEGCEANGEGAFRSSKVDGIGKVSEAVEENCSVGEYPDPEFHSFDKTMSSFAVHQVWALYDETDGMPRYYAQIREVSIAQHKLHMIWLELTKNSKYEIGEFTPVAFGKFRSGENEEIEDLLMFSHQMHCMKRSKNFIIYPKKGETWALFRDWDISWTTDPDKHKPPYKYDIVEVMSDFKEKVKHDDKSVPGIGVHYLEKVKGFVSLFARATQDKVLACNILPGEMHRFSHQVPSFRMTGMERVGVPPDSFELDPVALPKDIFELDPHKDNEEIYRQNLDGNTDRACPKAPEVEVKSMAGPESVCSPKKRQKTEGETGLFSKVSNGISNDQDKIQTNLSSVVEVEGLTRSHDSSSSCQVDEMNTMKKSKKSDQIVDALRLRRSSRVLSEMNNQKSSSQHKAEKKTAKGGEFSVRSDLYGLTGDKMNAQKKPEKDLMTDSLRIRRSPRGISKTRDGQVQGDLEKDGSNEEPLSQSKENVSLTESKGSASDTRVSSSCRTGQENAFNFKEEKSEDKFRVDQIWALYNDKGMPTEYGLIKKIETKPRFRLHVAPLEPFPLPKILAHPVCCGLFKLKTRKTSVFLRSSFSHQVSAQRNDRNSFEVYPRKGEVWALYKNSNNSSLAEPNNHDIVEVLENNGQIIKAMALTSNGSRTLYVAQRNQGSKTVVIDIPKADVVKFSHQIPAFRRESRRDERDCGCWELDPLAVPGLTIVLD